RVRILAPGLHGPNPFGWAVLRSGETEQHGDVLVPHLEPPSSVIAEGENPGAIVAVGGQMFVEQFEPQPRAGERGDDLAKRVCPLDGGLGAQNCRRSVSRSELEPARNPAMS
uniref:hypothetical protein n=1 Tax=Frankia sp. Cr2 TaxID=3073932 RepID=UPI002AD5483D